MNKQTEIIHLAHLYLLVVCFATTHSRIHRIAPSLDPEPLTFIYFNLVQGISPWMIHYSNRPRPLAHPSPSRALGTALIAWSTPSARGLGPPKIELQAQATLGYVVLGTIILTS
jgi:hypothetical protein